MLFLAAGTGLFDKFSVSRRDDWWGLVEINLRGPIDFTRLILPSMIKRNSGTLISISWRVLSESLIVLTAGWS